MLKIYQTYIARHDRRLDWPDLAVERHFTTDRREAFKVARSMLRTKKPLDEIGVLEMRGFDTYRIDRF